MGLSRDCPIFPGTYIISGTGKATDFKFSQYIQRVHPLTIFEKRERGRIQGLSNFFRYPLLSKESFRTSTGVLCYIV